MSGDNAIVVDRLSKDFRIYHEKSRLFSDHIGNTLLRRTKYDMLHVLRDISFTVGKGEIIGVIGNNGAGKTTLLRIIAGIIKPTSGNLMINGKIIPFLGLGIGFNPDLTAIDNIVLYGIILGFPKKEIAAKVPDVLAYAELEKFADTKIRHFSAGMHARLAFATAVLVEPDILLIDEVMGVGDISFRKKAYEAFLELINREKTVVLVSHNLNKITEMCDRTICLHNGQLHAIGKPEDVVKSYVELQQGLRMTNKRSGTPTEPSHVEEVE